jgi:TolB-like protein
MKSLALLLLAALSPAMSSTINSQSAAEPAEARLAAKTVAVLYFDNNTGKADYDNLGRGMAAMMITDLSAVPDIELVEREHLQDVLKEQENQQTRYFDPSTAVQAGKLLGAQYIVTGSFVAVEPSMRIDTRVINVETGKIVKAARVTGKEDNFFDLQQRLADSLVTGLSIALSPEQRQELRAQQEKNRVDKLSTVTAFSQALTLFDRDDYVGAMEKMTPLMRESPNSLMMQLTYAEMKRRAAKKTQDKAKDKAKSALKGIFKRP